MQFLYLIISIYFGRKNPLYFLIFPIALVSGPGAFIDPRTCLGLDDYFVFGKNMYKDVIIIFLLAVVIYLRKRINTNLILKTPMMFYGLYIVFLIILTFANSGNDYEAINVMRLFTHMILGYFLLLQIFSTANAKQFRTFFNTLYIATGILSLLYVLNSSKIFPVFYQEKLFKEVSMGNTSFFRDFSTIPYFSHFLFIIAFTQILSKSKMFSLEAVLFVLVTYPFVLLYTFTRSLLAGILIECALIIIILAIKNPKFILKTQTIVFVLAGVILFGIVLTNFGNELKYYNERIGSSKNEKLKEENVMIRIAYNITAYNIVKQNGSLLLGDGLNKKHESKMDAVGAWTADSTIPFFLIYTGALGVLFYYFLGFHFVYRTIVQLKNKFNPLTLSLFAIISATLISSIIMGGYRWGDPFIFFPFVMVITVETLMKKEKILKKQQLEILSKRIQKNDIPQPDKLIFETNA